MRKVKLVLRQKLEFVILYNEIHTFISLILVQMWHLNILNWINADNQAFTINRETFVRTKWFLSTLNFYPGQFIIEYIVIVFTGDGRWNIKTENFHLRRHVQHQFFSHGGLSQKRGPCLPVNCQVIVTPSRAQFIGDITWLSSQHVSCYFYDCCYVFRQIVPQCSQAPWGSDGRWWTIWMPCGDLWQGI